MINRFSLSTKTLAALLGLVLVAVASSGTALFLGWRARQIDRLVSHDVSGMLSAAELRTDLLRQRQAVAAYIMSGGERRWLDELAAAEDEFHAELAATSRHARMTADIAPEQSAAESALISRVAEADVRYDAGRAETLSLFDSGRVEEARRHFLEEMEPVYKATLAAADETVRFNRQAIREALQSNSAEMARLGAVMIASAALTVLLGLGVTWLLFRGVFHPIRKIAEQARETVEPVLQERPPDDVDELGALGYYFRTLTSEVAEARGELEESRRQAIQCERMAAVGQVVAHISHEIKNSLTAIGGFARMIERRPDDPGRVTEGARIIQRSAARMEHLVRETMEFSKPLRVEPAVRSLNALVREALAAVEPQIPREISVERDLGERLPEVPLDAESMFRVVTNLLGNALEAMDGVPGRLSVRTRAGEGVVALEVADSGPGIPPEARERIFEPFFSTKKKGTGLGLAICRQIVAGHGGELDFESEPGRGTTFRVTLPMTR